MTGPDPLRELLRRAGSGDNEAAGEIASRYEGELRRYVSRRLGDRLRSRVDTEDLLQSTFFVAMKHLPGLQYEDEGSFKAWLRAVAENKIRMAARYHGAARRDHRKDQPLDHVGERMGMRTTPSQAAMRSERTGDVRDAIAALPEEERQVVRLHSMEHRTFREIAEVLGLANEDRARYLFQKGLRAMAGILESPDDAPDADPEGAASA